MTMPGTGRSVASNRPMARRLEVRGTASGRLIATVACLAGLAVVALIGTLHPLPVAGSGQPGATAAALTATWDNSDATGGLNLVDLVTKGTIVLVLLFITLRVLGRMQTGAPKRGGRMEVLESRPLAPKASLHLVAIGDRRLVVGLTPSGMVSLAELDAAELEIEEAATELAGPPAAAASRTVNGSARPTMGSAVSWALGPVDALTGRLATFLNGSRVR